MAQSLMAQPRAHANPHTRARKIRARIPQKIAHAPEGERPPSLNMTSARPSTVTDGWPAWTMAPTLALSLKKAMSSGTAVSVTTMMGFLAAACHGGVARRGSVPRGPGVQNQNRPEGE